MFGIVPLFGGLFIFGLMLSILSVLATIWVIYDVIVHNKKISDGMKALWIILALLFGIITAILYYFIGRNGNLDLFKRKK